MQHFLVYITESLGKEALVIVWIGVDEKALLKEAKEGYGFIHPQVEWTKPLTGTSFPVNEWFVRVSPPMVYG